MLIVAAVFGGLALVIGLFFAIVHPFVCIVECALAKEHSGLKKGIWIVLSLVFGALGSLAYAMFVTRSVRLKRYSMQGFSVGILCLAVSSGIAFTDPEISAQFAGDLEEMDGEELLDTLQQQLDETTELAQGVLTSEQAEGDESPDSWTELPEDPAADLAAQMEQHMQAAETKQTDSGSSSTFGSLMDSVAGVFGGAEGSADTNAAQSTPVSTLDAPPVAEARPVEQSKAVSTTNSTTSTPPAPTETARRPATPVKRNRYLENRYGSTQAQSQGQISRQPVQAGESVVNRYTGR